MDKRKFENNYKQNTNLKNKSKTKDDRFYSLQLVTPARIQTSIHQTKLTSIIQDNDNIPFGNNINNKDKFPTRIIFSNTNGLNFDTDSHSLHELLISSQKYNTYILLLVETNTHWKNKRAYDNFRKTIAQHWKGTVVTISETNLSWDSIYKPGGTAIIVNNNVRSRKLKSGEDGYCLGR